MAHEPKYPHLGNVRLNDIDLHVRGPIQTEIINIQGRKINMGASGPDDHPINSTIIQQSWLGGGQIWDVDPAADMERFYWSTGMTEYAGFLTLSPYTYNLPGPVPSIPVSLGDFPNDDTARYYVAWGVKLTRWNEGTRAWDTVGTDLASTPQNEGVVYVPVDGPSIGVPLLFIPQGASYSTWNGTTVVAGTGGALDFAVWDNKLFRLTVNGSIDWTIDNVTWRTVAKLTDGSAPRHIFGYKDTSDRPTLYVATNQMVWSLEFDQEQLKITDMYYPRHPRQGYGAINHKGDAWISVGTGAHRFNLSTISPAGMDRDDGLPPEFRGYITDFTSSYNGLFALVRGTDISTTNETGTLDLGGGDEQIYVTGSEANAVLMFWNGVGWHYRWHGSGEVPVNTSVSQADGAYRVWWSAGGDMHYQDLPITYYNPRDPESALKEFAESSEFESGWFDWGWKGQVKVLKKFEFGVHWATEFETIEAYYKTNQDTDDWHYIGTMTEPGEYHFFLGLDEVHPILPNGNPRYLGISHERFRIRLILKRREEGSDPANRQKRPVLEWWAAIGRQVLNPQRSWRFVADLTQKVRGTAPTVTTKQLEELTKVTTAVPFQHLDQVYMVDVVAVNGPDDPSVNPPQSFRTIHLLESNEQNTTGINGS